MKPLKLVFGLVCLLILASNLFTMQRWSETRGVYDDLCYLRQAHLFQRFGISGLYTDISRDDDHFLEGKLKEIGFPESEDPSRVPCHTPMPGHTFVLQYPPGTGFLLALFPEGHQVVPLYAAASLIIGAFALLGIFYARSLSSTLVAGLCGALAVYLMINPAKASYSIAPTMAVCAAAGYLTALWLARCGVERRVLLPMLIGLLLGMAVNFRLPNLFLAAGYVLFLGLAFLRSRKAATLMQGVSFGVAFVVGMLPTLIANAINAGSPFRTTYGGADVVAPELKLSVLGQYLADMQFVLIVLAAGLTAWLYRAGKGGSRQVALITAVNLAVNLLFFLSHPIFTPYYVVPITMLSLWSLCFAWLMQGSEADERTPPDQAITA